MGLHNTLPADLTEVDIIIVGGKSEQRILGDLRGHPLSTTSLTRPVQEERQDV